jgi:hypothetical protein
MSSTYLRSLLLTSTFSFAMPTLLIGVFILSSLLLAQIPWLSPIGQLGLENILTFLAVFGNGSVLEGTMVIGLASSLVGAMFDVFASHRHQS